MFIMAPSQLETTLHIAVPFMHNSSILIQVFAITSTVVNLEELNISTDLKLKSVCARAPACVCVCVFSGLNKYKSVHTAQYTAFPFKLVWNFLEESEGT